MIKTLQQLHSRLSYYLHNVEKINCMITNSNYTIENGSLRTEVKISSIITPSEFYKHSAIFFTQMNEDDFYYLAKLLNQFIDNDEFKSIKVSGLIRHEDNREFKNEDIIFTGKVFLETNELLIDKNKAYQILKDLDIKYKGKKLSFSIRENKDWEDMDKKNWPSVFLCHDSKDKKAVEELYWELKSRSINVWYDKYSLVLGDSLTSKISEGLDDAKHGIVFISKSFLENEKWVKFELQTLMSKQIYSNNNTIIPIWLDIEEKDLEKHHWLREKLAVKFSDGIENVTTKIIAAIT